MANVRYNADVQNLQDLQNLVIGIIFRMDCPFTEDKAVSIVNNRLKGSSFYEDIPLIQKYVSDNLDLLQNRNIMRRRMGLCYMRNPLTHEFDPECYRPVVCS